MKPNLARYCSWSVWVAMPSSSDGSNWKAAIVPSEEAAYNVSPSQDQLRSIICRSKTSLATMNDLADLFAIGRQICHQGRADVGGRDGCQWISKEDMRIVRRDFDGIFMSDQTDFGSPGISCDDSRNEDVSLVICCI